MGIPNVYFDTLTATENLVKSGLSDIQARAISKEYANWMQNQVEQFATKEDIKQLDTKIDTKCNELRSELRHVEVRLDAKIDNLQSELHHVEARLDTKIDTKFTELDTKIDTKFNELDTKIDTKFNALDTKIDAKFDVWMWRMMVNMWGISATMAGLLFAALRFFN